MESQCYVPIAILVCWRLTSAPASVPVPPKCIQGVIRRNVSLLLRNCYLLVCVLHKRLELLHASHTIKLLIDVEGVLIL